MKSDRPSLPLNILCFFAPFVGLVVYLCLNGLSPRKARSAGWATLSGSILWGSLGVVIGIAVISFWTGFYNGIMNDYGNAAPSPHAVVKGQATHRESKR
jgi:hypothetical protein